MGNFGKLEEKVKALELRKQGLSYGEILLQIKVSKDTLSKWCRDMVLTEEQKLRLLRNKFLGQSKGSLIAADNKRQARILRTQTIFEQVKTDMGKLTSRDKFHKTYIAKDKKAVKRSGRTFMNMECL